MSDFTIRSTEHDDIILQDFITASLTFEPIQGARRYYANSRFGDMLFQEYNGKGFTIWYSNYIIQRPVTLVARGDMPVLELQIPLQDNFDSVWDGFGHTALKNGQFELSYAPFIHNKAMMQSTHYRTFDVHYELPFLESFAEQFPALAHFVNKVMRKEPVHLFGGIQFLSAELQSLVRAIIYNNYKGFVADRFYESAVTMLLIKILERMPAGIIRSNKISPADIEKAIEAKRIILSDFEKFHTIEELTRLVGTNTYKLKTAFKQTHGITIFKYSQSVRLDYAKRLLLDTDYTLQAIAELVGYTEGNNFQEAFKRVTGMTPGNFRKNGKI